MTKKKSSQPFRFPALSSTPKLVKSGPTTLTDLDCFNSGGDDSFIQLYDAPNSDSVVPGDAPLPERTCVVLAGGGRDSYIGALKFHKGLVVAATSTATGGSAPTTAVLVQGGYEIEG